MSTPVHSEVLALNSRQLAKKLLAGEGIPQDYYPEHFDWFWQSAYGVSAAHVSAEGEEDLYTRSWQDCFNPDSAPISPKAIFNIASITKPITAATILRMIEEEKYASYFPAGLDTKLSNFYDLIAARYPDSPYVRERLRAENPEISIKDLITHTSGIGDFDIPKYGQQFRFETPENLAKQGDCKHLEPERKDGAYGDYRYSDVGYELLGMIISAAASHQAGVGSVVTCGSVMREMVIDRLGLESTFTPDEMGFDDAGRVIVVRKPEQEIARGYDCQYSGNNLIESKVFRRCISCSAVYSNPTDICEFVQKTFSDKTFAEGGLFEKPETIALQHQYIVCTQEVKNPSGAVVKVEKRDPVLGLDCYGIGYSFFLGDDGQRNLIYHGARTAGYSGWFGYQDGKAACVLVNCQNLTTYFARALLEAELGRDINPLDLDPVIHKRFAEINAELFSKYSREELLGALREAKFHPSEKSKAENHRDLLSALSVLEASKYPATSFALRGEGAEVVVSSGDLSRK